MNLRLWAQFCHNLIEISKISDNKFQTPQDWEKEHFDNLSRGPSGRFGVPKRFEKTSEERKRHAAFIFAVTFVLILVTWIDVV